MDDEKDAITEMIEIAEEYEANKPWNKWPSLWFISFEIAALLIVLWAFKYFEVYNMLCVFTCPE